MSVPLWAIVPAAGSGSRLPSAYPKQYLELQGRSILQRTIDTLLSVPNLSGIVVALAEGDELWQRLPASSESSVITCIGGATRAESVVSGLNKVKEHGAEESTMVLVHDAARALTSRSDIVRLIEQVAVNPDQGGILATRVQDTIKKAIDEAHDAGTSVGTVSIANTIDRQALWHAQTPQLFRLSSLLDALISNEAAIKQGQITDESSAMEIMGFKPIMVEALEPNFKITRAVDLTLAHALLSDRQSANQTTQEPS